MITARESTIISQMKLYAIIGVVFIHAPKVYQSPFVDLISKYIPSACVPLFFVLSGYFLFRKEIEIKSIAITEIKKRIISLLIPFLLWNSAILVLSYIAMKISPSLSTGGQYTISNYSFNTVVSALFGINRFPINSQFWFIRNLMILVLFAYFFKQFLLKFPWLGLALAIAIDQKIGGAIFFYIGGIIATQSNPSIFVIKHAKTTIAISLCVFSLTFYAKIPNPILICASFSFLAGISNIALNNKYIIAAIASLSSYVFFIYAAHLPIITILERICWKFPAISNLYAIEYIGLPVLAILVTWVAALFSKKYFARFYAISTGSR